MHHPPCAHPHEREESPSRPALSSWTSDDSVQLSGPATPCAAVPKDELTLGVPSPSNSERKSKVLTEDTIVENGQDVKVDQAAVEKAAEAELQAQVLAALMKPEKLASHPLFNGLIAFAIVVNGLVMGLQTDMEDHLVFTVCTHMFTAIWTFEMVLRLFQEGVRGYFSESWNCVDFVLAWLSIVDSWVLVFLAGAGSNTNSLRRFSILRVLRLARLVKLVKLLRAFRELWLLVNGLVEACRLLVWVVVLLLVAVYVGALFMTDMVGKECDEGGEYSDWNECSEMFGTIFESMYTLFQVITLESWSMAVARPVMKEKPWMVMFFVVFLYTTCFGLMNVAMGVIVEQTLKASEENSEKLILQTNELNRRELGLLRGIFQCADTDGGGSVTTAEFLSACQLEDVKEKFAAMDLEANTEQLALRLFEVLDTEGRGEMTIDQLLERAFVLKEEGRRLNRDHTLLLIEVMHQSRVQVQVQGQMRAMEERTLTGQARLDDNLGDLKVRMENSFRALKAQFSAQIAEIHAASARPAAQAPGAAAATIGRLRL